MLRIDERLPDLPLERPRQVMLFVLAWGDDVPLMAP